MFREEGSSRITGKQQKETETAAGPGLYEVIQEKKSDSRRQQWFASTAVESRLTTGQERLLPSVCLCLSTELSIPVPGHCFSYTNISSSIRAATPLLLLFSKKPFSFILQDELLS